MTTKRMKKTGGYIKISKNQFRSKNDLSTYANRLKVLNLAVEAGFFPSAKYKDGTFVAQVAYYNEKGTEKSPPRPFMSRAFNLNVSFLKRNVIRAIRVANKDEKKGLRMLKKLANKMKLDIEKSIASASSWATENAESTRIAKGNKRGTDGAGQINDPLIDTGKMIDSVKVNIILGIRR